MNKYMRKVKNKKVIRRLAFQSMKESRKKYLVIVFSIMLTCIMFTTLFSVAISMNENTQRSTMRQVGGSSMAGLKYILPKDYQTIAADSAVKDPSYRILIANAENKDLIGLNTEINYAEDKNAENMFCKVTTGNMPEKRLDIVTNTIVLDALGIPHEIGAAVPLEFTCNGKKYKETFTLCGYYTGDPVFMAQQCFLSRIYCDEVAPTPKTPYEKNTSHDTCGYWMMDFNFSNSWDIEGKTIELLKRNGYDPQQQKYGINWAYTTSEIDPQSAAQALALVALILLSGYLIIYNVFYINVTADIQRYGLLKTIGTTKRQLKKMVHWQAFLLSLYGIPLGLLVGTAASSFLLPIVISNILSGNVETSLSFNPLIYLFAVLFTFFTVWLSLQKPCRTAGKVSPVEAVAYIESNTYHKKKKKSRHVSAYSMSVANLGRNKKKTAVVVLSLSLSLLLFNSTYLITKSFDIEQYLSTTIIGDFAITHPSINNFSAQVKNFTAISPEDTAQFENLEGVESVSNVYYSADAMLKANNTFLKILGKIGTEDIGDYEQENIQDTLDDKLLFTDLYGIDDFVLKQLEVKKGKIDRQKFASGRYVIIYAYQLIKASETLQKETDGFYQVGEKVSITLPDGKKQKYEVMAVAEVPYALSTKAYSSIGAQVMLPDREFLAHTKETGALYSILNVKEDSIPTIDHFLENYTEQKDGELSYTSKQSYLDEFEGFVQMYEIIGIALGAILMLIGILNFINSIVTGIFSRSREFAMLEAVGMTGRQLTLMSVFEGLFYAFFTVLFSLGAATVLSKTLIEAIAGEIWFFHYQFTLLPIVLCIPFLLLLACAVPYYALRSIRRQSVVERIKML